MADGRVRELPVKPLAHVLLAIADETALLISATDDTATMRRDAMAVVTPLLDALKP
ncbi:hypothetical protein [Spirillospora sp. NPDC048819]|uniref:hypothetical protein n=1 Tax=Spirillospora sp. NPDC048819 TaxID=3155268 RepID=UPI0033F2A582